MAALLLNELMLIEEGLCRPMTTLLLDEMVPSREGPFCR
jgi:hypothetical protein